MGNKYNFILTILSILLLIIILYKNTEIIKDTSAMLMGIENPVNTREHDLRSCEEISQKEIIKKIGEYIYTKKEGNINLILITMILIIGLIGIIYVL
jgi:hypothetical protein